MEACHSEQTRWGNISNQIQSHEAFTQLQGHSFIFTLSLTLSAPQGQGALTKRSRLGHLFCAKKRGDPVVTLLVVAEI